MMEAVDPDDVVEARGGTRQAVSVGDEVHVTRRDEVGIGDVPQELARHAGPAPNLDRTVAHGQFVRDRREGSLINLPRKRPLGPDLTASLDYVGRDLVTNRHGWRPLDAARSRLRRR